MANEPNGTYLIRFSNSIRGELTISWKDNNNVLHTNWGNTSSFDVLAEKYNLLFPKRGGISLANSVDKGYLKVNK